MPGPLARYQLQVQQGELMPDPAQASVVVALQRLFEELTEVRKKRWWPFGRHNAIQGIYLVGPVGRGKTHLMDLLVASLTQSHLPTWRIHFHGFMLHIQNQLKQREGQSDPLISIADEMAKSYRVLCLDECHVEDIGDAMILGELLHRLFQKGLVLVTTSNQTPDELYTDGLQRQRFLPAIEIIKTHCRVIPLEAQEDYRLRTLTQAPTYFSPITPEHAEIMAKRFEALSGQPAHRGTIRIDGRSIATLGQGGSVAWFDFATLCQTERSVRDYRMMFDQFNTILVSDLPILGVEDDNATKRLIHLVDEAYDRAIKLIFLAQTPPDQLYQGQRLKAQFERTVSRLTEMQSQDYLAQSSR